MPWIFIAIFAWIAVLILAGWKGLKYSWPGGLTALVIQYFVDVNFTRLGLYKLHMIIGRVIESSIFYSLMIFAMGVIFVYYLPRTPWLKMLHVLMWSLLFFLEELLLINFGALQYLHWNHLGSLFVDILTIATIALIAETFQFSGGAFNE